MDPLRNIYPPQAHARPPKYVTDPQNWEWSPDDFDGRPRAKAPEDGSAPSKFEVVPPKPRGAAAAGPSPLLELFTRDVADLEAEWTDEARPLLEDLGFFDFDLDSDTNP